MKSLVLNRSGELAAKDLAYFGGHHSLLDKLFMKGVGSSRIIYDAGIPEFDHLNRGISSEIGFANFELLKNGLILRLNQNQRLACIGMKLNDIQQINFVGFRIELKRRRGSRVLTSIVHRGELEIVESKEVLNFSVITREFKSIKNFFSKKPIIDKFNFSISTNPPEKEFEIPIEWLEMLDL